MAKNEKCECWEMGQFAILFAEHKNCEIITKGGDVCEILHAVFDGFAGLHLMHSTDKGMCLCPKCGKILCRGCGLIVSGLYRKTI